MSAPEGYVKRPDTAEEMFAILRDFFDRGPERSTTEIMFSTASQQRERVWEVLSALRGPDNGDEKAKIAWTYPIRRAVIGERFAEWSFPDPLPDSHEAACERLTAATAHFFTKTHFVSHVRSAFFALGLSIGEVNK